MSRYTPNYPNGDQGGNLFTIEPSEPDLAVTNLHSVWDSVGYAYSAFIVQPLSEHDWDYLTVQASEVMRKNPYASFDYAELSRPESEWWQETYDLADKIVYRGIVENEPPTADYIALAEATAKRQLAKGGYRLADYLIQMKADYDALNPTEAKI